MNGSAELKRDREAVLQAVRQHGHPLQFAAEELRGNHEVVLEAVRQDGYALQLSSEELRGDRESFLDRVREKGFVLRNTSDDLKRHREIVLEAVTPSVLQEGPHAASAEYNAAASTPSGGNKRGEPLRFVLASHVGLDQVLHPFACNSDPSATRSARTSTSLASGRSLKQR